MFIYNEKLSEYPEYAHYRKMVALVDAGCAGTDDVRAFLVCPSVTEAQLSKFGWEMALEHAESYGIYFSDEIVDDEDGNEYSDQMGTSWENYDPAKHDGKLIFGNYNDFQWDTYE